MSTKRKANIDPLSFIVGHQKVGHEDADRIALSLLLHLDLAKRGQGNGVTSDFLFQRLLTAQIIASKAGNRPICDMSAKAIASLVKAIGRPAEVLSLTTGEYLDIRKCIVAYLRILPTATLKLVGYAGMTAQKILQEGVMEEAA